MYSCCTNMLLLQVTPELSPQKSHPTVLGRFNQSMEWIGSINRYLRSYSGTLNIKKIHSGELLESSVAFWYQGFDPIPFHKENDLRFSWLAQVTLRMMRINCLAAWALLICQMPLQDATQKTKKRHWEIKRGRRKEPTMWCVSFSFVAWFIGLSVLFQAPAWMTGAFSEPT